MHPFRNIRVLKIINLSYALPLTAQTHELNCVMVMFNLTPHLDQNCAVRMSNIEAILSTFQASNKPIKVVQWLEFVNYIYQTRLA